MRRRLALLAFFAFSAAPVGASTYFEVEKVCPIDGEKFSFLELGSISQWGSLPDGMPLGSGYFPIQLAQCPKNGMVLYRDFDAPTIQRLKPVIKGEAYQALYAAEETRYFLAYHIARELGDPDAPWLLLSATWEAKNEEPAGARARRYGEAFVTLVQSLPFDPTRLDSIALRARASNALRELGRFEEAEALRSAIHIAPDAGGQEQEAEENRQGWKNYLARLALPIARREQSRAPIDMIGNREAAARCLSHETAEKRKDETSPPLTELEVSFCKASDIQKEIVRMRAFNGE